MFPVDDNGIFMGSNSRMSVDGGNTWVDVANIDFNQNVWYADTSNQLSGGVRVPADPSDLRRGLAQAAQHDKRIAIDRCPSDVMDEALAVCEELGAELKIEDKVDDDGILATRALLITKRGRASEWINPAASRPWHAAFKKLGLIE